MVPEIKASLNTHYTNTHDRFFRSCFKDMNYTKALLKFWLPKEVQDVLDVTELVRQDASLPTIGKEADLLLRGQLKNARPIYILLEHKHQRDPKKTYKQMADYGVAIKHVGLASKKQFVILNCIFYHGLGSWQKESKQGLGSMICDVGLERIECIMLNFHVLDLGCLDVSLWPNKGALYSILYSLLKVQQFGDMAGKDRCEFFRQIFSHLDDNDSTNLMQHVVTYVSSVCGIDHEEVMSMLKSSGAASKEYLETWEQNMGNPWKEAGRKQGRAEGLEKGRIEGLNTGLKKGRAEERVAVAMNMLKEGADAAFVMKVTGLSQDEIAKLKT